MAFSRYYLVCLILTLALVGCSGAPAIDAGVIVSGKVVNGGQPIAVANRQNGVGKLQIELIPILGTNDKRDRDSTGAKEDGSFEFLYAGKGVKPGKYKLVVLALDEPMKDSLNGTFNEANSPIEVDIPADKLNGKFSLGTIDLEKYKK